MEKYEAYDTIVDLVLKNKSASANNIIHHLPNFSERNEARINLMLEDMHRLVPKAFNLKFAHDSPVLIANIYTALLKEDGGFRPYLEAQISNRSNQKVTFQKADGSNPLKDLHHRVQEVSARLFEDGHFADAIFRAFTALNIAVKNATKLNLDNTPLMQSAFSPKNPILKISDDSDEQQGFMWMFSGAMMGIRNPKAHKIVEQNDPQRTLEWLSYASVLFRVLDESTVPMQQLGTKAPEPN